MEQSLQSRTDGVAFRRPVFHLQWKRFTKRIWRNIEWYGRTKAARTLAMHGHHDVAKNLLEDHWK
jgi:hypothetical protein